MSPHSERLTVLPRQTSSAIFTSAVSRAAWLVSILILLVTIPLVVNVFEARMISQELPLPISMLLAMVGLSILTAIRPSRRARIVMLVGGALLAGIYELSILNSDRGLDEVGTYILNRGAFVLVLIGPGITKPIIGLLWSAIGYIVATATLVTTALISGRPLVPGWGPTIAFGIYGSVFLALALIRANQASQLPDLARLEEETRRMALEHQFELRAAAMIHDTVLNDLSTVMNSDGPMDERTRERFRQDVETMSHGSWLRESRGLVTFDSTDEALRNGMVALVSDLQWRGLTVEVTGNPPNVLRLSPERVVAIHDAVRACLENVLKHANTTSAELSLGAADGRVTIMVIDHGDGFDPATIANDRLGLRASVVNRIESLGGSVKIWSQVGQGTSIVLTMPVEVVDEP